MKITLTLADETHDAALPYAGAPLVNVAGAPCDCGSVAVAGRGRSIESHDTYRADAHCCGCGAARGVLRVTMSTIFGIEEDERVLNGRCRVY